MKLKALNGPIEPQSFLVSKHWRTRSCLQLRTLAFQILAQPEMLSDRSLRFPMLCKGSWIITRINYNINSKQKMHPKRSKKWAWSWSLACALDSRPTVAFGTVAARIPVGSLLWLVWHRDRIKGDNGAWSVDIWVSSKWGTKKTWKIGMLKTKRLSTVDTSHGLKTYWDMPIYQINSMDRT